jgi:hypothetical protein
MWMRYVVICAAVAYGPPSQAQAVPKIGTCPSSYHASGGACVPNSSERSARPALTRIGPCPSGYHSSGDYCLGSSDTAKHAIPRMGSCPSGYHSSGSYCLSNR